MVTDIFVRALESVRDHLTIAIRDAQRGDTHSAVQEVESAIEELHTTAEEHKP